VLGSRKLSSGKGSIFGQPHCTERGYGGDGGHTRPQSTKSADQPPGFGPLFCPCSVPVPVPVPPPFPVSNWGGNAVRRVRLDLPFPSLPEKGAGETILGSSREHSPRIRINWTLASDSSVERPLSHSRVAMPLKLTRKSRKFAKIRVSGLDQKAEINPSHLRSSSSSSSSSRANLGCKCNADAGDPGVRRLCQLLREGHCQSYSQYLLSHVSQGMLSAERSYLITLITWQRE
jgi:hypothetical protein